MNVASVGATAAPKPPVNVSRGEAAEPAGINDHDGDDVAKDATTAAARTPVAAGIGTRVDKSA